MSFHSLVASFAEAPLDDLADFDRQMALDAGLSTARVNEWQLVHTAYFGPTTAPARQHKAADEARSAGLSLDVLAQIERCISHIKHTATRDSLRMRLLQAARTVARSCAALARLAKSLVPEHETTPQQGVTFTGSRKGTRSMKVTSDEHFIAAIEATLRHGTDSSRPLSPQMLTRFEELITDPTGDNGVARALPRPQLLIPLPEYVRILRGEGDDVVLGLTDGTTMTGADFLTKFFANGGAFGAGPDGSGTGDNTFDASELGLEAALFHPTEGAVNLYRTQRLSNQKQRDLARATQPICAVPGCRHGAHHCEIHHITAWKNGGETNIANLAPLCSYHNRVNDDDPRRRKRGRIEMRRGQPVWVSPRGYARRNDRHPFGAMESLFGHSPAPS